MGYHGGASGLPGIVSGHNDNGGSAARFFYCAKAGKADRDEGCDGLDAHKQDETRSNHHPTVKPTDLMRYLCRLVTPSGGTVLDPFMGSGSTGKAATLEGFSFVGCELQPEYIAIAEARIRHAEGEVEPLLRVRS
jgi:site-specific DNA-methyltransferase (adenine-specific)